MNKLDIFREIINQAIYEIFFLEFGIGEEYDKVFTVKDSVRFEENIPINISGGKSFDYTFRHQTFKEGFKFALADLQKDPPVNVAKLARILANCMKNGYEIKAAEFFDHAFNKKFPSFDGLPLCCFDHSNRLDKKLSYLSLKKAIKQMVDLKLTPALLLIPRDLELLANKILEQIKSTDKVFSNINLQVMTRLTNPRCWFLLAKERESLVFFWRLKPDLKNDFSLKSVEVEYNSVMRFSLGAIDWKFVIGSPGRKR